MTRAFFIVAALYDFAWVAILLVIPGKIMLKMPPTMVPMIVLIALVGVACVVCAVKVRRWLVALVILGKIGGPVNFVAAVMLGYLAWSQWWMPVVNDLIWLPMLIAVWRKVTP